MVKKYQKVCRTCDELYRTNMRYSQMCDNCKKQKKVKSKKYKVKQDKKLEKKKDREWTKEIGLIYNRTCVICGSTKLPNAHHIIPKTFKETRWDKKNGIILCPKCHKFGKYSAHKHPLWFTMYLINNHARQATYLINKIKEIEDGITN